MTDAELEAAFLREAEAGQWVNYAFIGPELNIKCRPGYVIVATRTRDGSTFAFEPMWDLPPEQGVARTQDYINRLGMAWAYRDVRAVTRVRDWQGLEQWRRDVQELKS